MAILVMHLFLVGVLESLAVATVSGEKVKRKFENIEKGVTYPSGTSCLLSPTFLSYPVTYLNPMINVYHNKSSLSPLH